MFRKQRRNIVSNCNLQVTFLAFLWIGFIALGATVSVADFAATSLMRNLVSAKLTFAGFLISSLAPYFILFIGFLTGQRCISLIIFLLNAFATGYTLGSIASYYGRAGWLLQFLLLFSGTVTNSVLLWTLFRNIFRSSKIDPKDQTIGLCIIVSSVLVDRFFISPFFALLSN